MKNLGKLGIKNQNFKWFKSYLTLRKQCIPYGKTVTSAETIKCGVPQCSILETLLFLIFVNGLQYPTRLLNPTMNADYTYLFYSHRNINNCQQRATKFE